MASASRTPSVPHVAEIRRFNRFYTRQIGVLQEGLLRSPFSLTEVRVLYEIAHGKQATAVVLCRQLGLDAGYVSRILRSFEKRGLIGRTRSNSDGRQQFLSLTPLKGQQTEAHGHALRKLHLRNQRRADRCDLCLCLCPAHARLQSRDTVQAGMIATLLPV